jgi:hypothetical protein
LLNVQAEEEPDNRKGKKVFWNRNKDKIVFILSMCSNPLHTPQIVFILLILYETQNRFKP